MQPQSATGALPFVDEHARVVAATPEATWRALSRTLPRATGGRLARQYARAVHCQPATDAGEFPEQGSRIVAFHVAHADAPRELALAGRHRFSNFTLTFRLEPYRDDRATRLRAETRAEFPGLAGRLYRAAVIGTGGHAIAMRRLLGGVARAAERGP